MFKITLENCVQIANWFIWDSGKKKYKTFVYKMQTNLMLLFINIAAMTTHVPVKYNLV